MMEQTNTQNAYPTLSMILKSQSQLYDLHTHLLGMGNASFWVDTLLMDPKIMPRNSDFNEQESIRQKFCPLVWDTKEDTGFVNSTETANFFNYLIVNNILPVEEDNIQPSDNINFGEQQKTFSDVIKDLNSMFSPVLNRLISEEFNKILLHQGLNFKENFSYDVVLTLSDLAKALGIKNMGDIDFEQLAVTERLVGYSSPGEVKFNDWIIFDARKQMFNTVYGIQVEELRKLITVDPNKPNEATKLARAHIINAFSMCDPQGTPARLVDFHNFHGSFTPEFYPRRFALKDCMYGQRLDILAVLIAHIIERYQTCLPPVQYCEFSVGVEDLCKPWVFDVLRSVRLYSKTERKEIRQDSEKRTYIASDTLTSFSQLVLENSFPHLAVAFNKPEYSNTTYADSRNLHVTYKFLAGFGRQNVQSPLPTNQIDALRLLYDSPQEAILLMMKEIAKSKNDANKSKEISEPSRTTDETTSGPFGKFLSQLKKLKSKGEETPSFYNWVVGLDLFADELGYPYCPFVARPFIDFIHYRRSKDAGEKRNERFGLRIHCGENVIYADDDSSAYRLFIAHMYIVFRCLRFLQREINYGIRIGHGIAFDRILGTTMNSTRHRKSSVLLAEMREHAKYLFKNIALEVNITSNEYLLGQMLRQGNFGQTLRLDALIKLKVFIILATDDDGIWPIDQCPFIHPGHHSLSAEYCRAISSSLIKTSDQLEHIFETTKNFCFSNQGGKLEEIKEEDLLPPDDGYISSIIIHPNIIELILEEYKNRSAQKHPALQNFKIYSENTDRSKPKINWKNSYGSLRTAFICACANYDDDNNKEENELRKAYSDLFKKPEDKSNNIENEFDFIYKNWRKIRSTFMFPEQNKSPETGRYVVIEKKHKTHEDYVIYSESQNDLLKKPLHDIFIDFLNEFSFRKVEIHVFAQNMDIEKLVEHINRQLNAENGANIYQNMTVFIFTNKNKYKYTYSKIDKRFKLQVNPTPLKRNCDKENFLYALCPHASAATAALYLISEQLSGTVINVSTPASENIDAIYTYASESYTQNYLLETNSAESKVIMELLPKSQEKNAGKETLKRQHSKETTVDENQAQCSKSSKEKVSEFQTVAVE